MHDHQLLAYQYVYYTLFLSNAVGVVKAPWGSCDCDLYLVPMAEQTVEDCYVIMCALAWGLTYGIEAVYIPYW